MLPADSPFASPAAPGPHPATAELRAYAAGTLGAADEHRIEAHTLDCERCAELLGGFSMSDAATTDQALAQLRARLQARVGQEDPATSGWAWPRIAVAAAALAAVAGAGIWGWEQQAAAPVSTATVRPAPATAAPPVALAPPPAAVTSKPNPATPADYAATPPRRPKSHIAPQAADQSLGGGGWTANSAPRLPAPAPRRPAAPAAEPAAALAMSATSATADVAQAPQAPPAPNDKVAAVAIDRKSAVLLPANEGAPEARVAPDSTQALSEVVVTSPVRKAKAAPAAAAAMVANTPMPAAVAIAPAPVTGTPALRDYLRREAAKFELEEGAKPLNGVVRLRFVVGADGKLSNLQVVRGMRADYDEEALRLVCEGPAWRPGIAGGRRAALPVELTISF